MRNSVFAATSTLALMAASSATAGPEAEVLHWWTSGAEAKSVTVLQEEFAANGGTWTDMPVAGGGGDADISTVAEAEGWNKVLPASIAAHMKCEGTWCAAPVNVHRVDWLWANAEILAANGIEKPTSWEDFNAAADKLQAAGVIPLAHGGQA